MNRTIEGFHQDEHGDWVAELRCGHGQHVRHKPPFWSRPWTLTEDGRRAMLGRSLPCVLCERFEIPRGYEPYRRTSDFTTTTIPSALQHDHTTRAGVWGVIHVLEGRLRYIVEPPLARNVVLEPGTDGVVAPEVPHRVAPEGHVRFFVEFHRRA